jgi:pyroglutamyl-peptidase
MTVLVLGFGQFRNLTINPSGLIARDLNGLSIAEHRVVGEELPVATRRVGPTVAALCQRERPDLIVVVGLALGREAPALERVAINVRDFPTPDADCLTPIDEPVLPDGPDAYITNLPIKAILSAWRTANLPGYISNTAGTYVCNQTFYLACDAAKRSGARAGLVHIPATPPTAASAPAEERDLIPTMELEALRQAVELTIDVSIRHGDGDLPFSSGAVS